MTHFWYYLAASPNYFYLGVAAIFALLSLGCILGWRWLLTPISPKQRWFHDLIGPSNYRIFSIVVFFIIALLAAFASLSGYYN